MENKDVKTNKPKKKYSKKALYKAIIIISCIIVGVPLLVFGYTLIDSSIKGSSPVVGSRFENELDPEIKDSDIESLKTAIAAVEGVESVDEVVLNTGSLRIYVNVSDDYVASGEDSSKLISTVAENVYKAVDSVLPIGTYFTSTDVTKMYDLSIYSYNHKDADDSWYCYLISKNASSSDRTIQVVSQARDEELAERLRNKDAE